ncbi:Tex family protein [Neptuniibacter sp.]|uniref:Tex family protein n=1 Tax=Neptuniibacter sp. TaxID=1962643 RepID=UPI003B59A8EE
MIEKQIATELGVQPQQVKAAMQLLDEGSTVPFIARYRKEMTGALDDGQLRTLQQRLTYLRELGARKELVINNIRELNQLSSDLEKKIAATLSKTELEDLYQPFKSKRVTKAQQAREAGLEQLLSNIIKQPNSAPETLAVNYCGKSKNFNDAGSCLEGAKAILSDQLMAQIPLLQNLRDTLWHQGIFSTSVIKKKESEGAKFRDYFSYSEAIKKIPSHRMLAILRGVNEGILKSDLSLDNEERLQSQLSHSLTLPKQGQGGIWLQQAVHETWRKRCKPKLSKELINRQKENADTEAIQVFSRNLKELLLAAPAGSKSTLGLDPGLRTGVKVAIVDGTGKLVAYDTIYPHPPHKRWDESIDCLQKLCKQHQVELVSIGNGTGSRETDKLVAELKQKHPELTFKKLITSEAGASVYSASELAAAEFPDLDVTIRGAVSIARRLQDPLAELVKIEPKAIGVGQYQHDVNQNQLSTSLDAVIEDCVNAVGVDLNSASEALLNHVSGLNSTLAKNIVSFRDENGPFQNRIQLKKVPRLGPKAFEQSAAFLRVNNGTQPLDSSGVHPEAYGLVKRIAQNSNKSLSQLIGNSDLLSRLNAVDYIDDQFGIYTVKDILKELDKPGRDPRPEFKTATLREGVEKIADLYEGMELEGTVTNVTNFGAFVDVGVHQDGLVHISQLADRFVKDPHDVVSTGQIVKVRVTEVDTDRKRIALSMRSQQNPSPKRSQKTSKNDTNSSMSAAFQRATLKK